MPRRTWRWVAACLVVAAVCLGAGGWVRSRQDARERAEGLGIAREAAALSRRAREVGFAGRPDEAARLLDHAVGLLRAARGGRGTPYASLLADLASLRLSQIPQNGASRASARALLDEARRIGGVPAGLRVRILRDLGCACLLDGDLRAAETWYAEVLRLSPADSGARERLQLLRETRGSGLAADR